MFGQVLAKYNKSFHAKTSSHLHSMHNHHHAEMTAVLEMETCRIVELTS